MSKIVRANITPEIIAWARNYANVPLDLLSRKVGVSVDHIEMWERGERQPTINQLMRLAKVCNVPISLFFLDKPPEVIPLPVNDLRQLYYKTPHDRFSYELTSEIRNAERIRKLALEMFSELEIQPPEFSFKISTNLSNEQIGLAIRNHLGINFERQKAWKTSLEAFNEWRRSLEKQNIIVLQATQVDITIMRGFSLSEELLPVIVVNRKDAYNGRIFSLIHEFIHIATRTSGLCDFSYDNRIEAYCNRITAHVLMPKNEFLNEVYKTTTNKGYPTDSEIKSLSKIFSVSKDTILRHLLTYQFISKSYYQEKQEAYKQELDQIKKNKKASKGFLVKRSATDVISQQGYYYPSLVMNAYFDRKITEHKAMSMLRIKSKYVDELIRKLSTNSLVS